MKAIPLLCVSLLLASVFFLQGTSQHQVAVIRAMDFPMKLRPVCFADPVTDGKREWFQECYETYVFCSGSCVGLDAGWPNFEERMVKCTQGAQRYEAGTEPSANMAMVVIAGCG
mgnify:FL=1